MKGRTHERQSATSAVVLRQPGRPAMGRARSNLKMAVKRRSLTIPIAIVISLSVSGIAVADNPQYIRFTHTTPAAECVQVVSVFGHGSSGAGRSRGQSEFWYATDFGAFQAACNHLRTLPAGSLRATVWLMRDTSTTSRYVCRGGYGTDSNTNTSRWYHQVTFSGSQSVGTCGSGNYSTHTLGQVQNGGQWIGGNLYVNSGRHSLLTTSE